MGRQLIKTEDVATIIDSIIYSDSEEYGDLLEWGFDSLEKFSEILRDSEGTFVINSVNLGGLNND